MVRWSKSPRTSRTQWPPMMSIAGITSTPLSSRTSGVSATKSREPALSVVRELQRSRDVLRFAQVFDHELQRVLVLADHAKLVPLDPHLDLGCHVLDALAKIAGQLIGDARVEVHLDLPAALTDRLGVVSFEQLG